MKRLLRASTMGAFACAATLFLTAAEPEKGGQKLAQSSRPLRTVQDCDKVQAGDAVLTACASCKTIQMTRVERKGGQVQAGVPATKAVEGFACPGCKNVIDVKAQGKERTAHVKHVCRECGGEAFCSVVPDGQTGKTDSQSKKTEKTE